MNSLVNKKIVFKPIINHAIIIAKFCDICLKPRAIDAFFVEKIRPILFCYFLMIYF